MELRRLNHHSTIRPLTRRKEWIDLISQMYAFRCRLHGFRLMSSSTQSSNSVIFEHPACRGEGLGLTPKMNWMQRNTPFTSKNRPWQLERTEGNPLCRWALSKALLLYRYEGRIIIQTFKDEAKMILEYNFRQVISLSAKALLSHLYIKASACCPAFWRVFIQKSTHTGISRWCDLV